MAMFRGAIIVLAGGLMAAACGSESGPKTQDMPFNELRFIIARSCASSSCHGDASMPTGNLLMSPTDAFCNLTGPTSGLTFRTTAQGDFPRRVVAGDRAHSFLYKKLSLTDAEMGETMPLGERMPKGGMLDPVEVEKFGAWIDAGARDQNGTTGSCQ